MKFYILSIQWTPGAHYASLGVARDSDAAAHHSAAAERRYNKQVSVNPLPFTDEGGPRVYVITLRTYMRGDVHHQTPYYLHGIGAPCTLDYHSRALEQFEIALTSLKSEGYSILGSNQHYADLLSPNGQRAELNIMLSTFID